MCVGTLYSPLAICARGVLRSALRAPEVPEDQVEDARVLWVHFPRTVDDVLVGFALWDETHSRQHSPDVNINRNIDGIVVCHFYAQIPHQNICCHGRDLWVCAIELKESTDDSRARRSPRPDCSSVSIVDIADAVDSLVHILGHDVVEPME